jgi:hypothetical protein
MEDIFFWIYRVGTILLFIVLGAPFIASFIAGWGFIIYLVWCLLTHIFVTKKIKAKRAQKIMEMLGIASTATTTLRGRSSNTYGPFGFFLNCILFFVSNWIIIWVISGEIMF